jgi:hypothetical protein
MCKNSQHLVLIPIPHISMVNFSFRKFHWWRSQTHPQNKWLKLTVLNENIIAGGFDCSRQTKYFDNPRCEKLIYKYSLVSIVSQNSVRWCCAGNDLTNVYDNVTIVTSVHWTARHLSGKDLDILTEIKQHRFNFGSETLKCLLFPAQTNPGLNVSR